MTMITPSYLGETIEYSSLHACRSTLEDPTFAYRRCTIVSGCLPDRSGQPNPRGAGAIAPSASRPAASGSANRSGHGWRKLVKSASTLDKLDN